MNTLFINCFFLVLLFLLSGYNKMFNLVGTANSLKNKINKINLNLNIPLNFYIVIIILVIILQIGSSLTILYSAYTNKYKQYAYYSSISLIIFTVLATAIYHFPPFGSNYYDFMRNVSIIGGLLLLTNINKN